MQDQEKQAAVPYFIHEGVMTRMDMAMDKMGESNKRMLSALRTVCITLVVVVVLFVAGYTINNNNWIRYVEQLQAQQAEGVKDGAETSEVRQFPSQGAHQGADPFTARQEDPVPEAGGWAELL